VPSIVRVKTPVAVSSSALLIASVWLVLVETMWLVAVLVEEALKLPVIWLFVELAVFAAVLSWVLLVVAVWLVLA
jgi:hypothetical protein